jgi:hypothetical protein
MPAPFKAPAGKTSGIQLISTQQAAKRQAGPKPSPQRPSSFGEIDLGSDEEPLPDLAGQEPAAPKPQPRPSKPHPDAAPDGEAEDNAGAVDDAESMIHEKRPPAERPHIRVHSAEEGSSGKWVKWVVIVLAVLAVIGGGVYGVLKWREAAERQRLEELARLNQGSLDSLKDQAMKKEGVSP